VLKVHSRTTPLAAIDETPIIDPERVWKTADH
jgi:hypothetical protein